MRGVFRVERVLRGDSPAVAVEAVDTAARRVRLELAAEEAAELRQGAVLIVEWWAAEVPAPSEERDLAGGLADLRDMSEPSAKVEDDEDDETNEREFRALIGLD